MPPVTVIVTTHNLENTIEDCLRDLFSQTFQQFDLLMVDDCSSDGTREILQRWQAKYPDRIKLYLLEEKLGMPARTRNAALQSGLVDGEFFLFQDGDDRIEPTLLETLYRLAVQQDADVAVCAYDRVERASGRTLCREMTGFPSVVELPPTGDLLAFINTAPWNKLWRRSRCAQLRYSDFRVGEEVAPQLRCFAGCRRIAFTDQVLIHYQVHADSVISNTAREDILAFAQELARCQAEVSGVYRDTLGLMAYLHIGLSMAIRAADNPQIDTKAHLRWTKDYLAQEFNWLKGNRFLRLSSLSRHGVKGLLLWGCYRAYRAGCFEVVLGAYRLAARMLHMEIRF